MKRTFLGKIDTRANRKYFYFFLAILLIFFSASLGYGQTNGETQANSTNAKVFWVPESFISVLSIVVAILTGLVAIIIIITTWMTFVQLRRFDREFAGIKETAEKQIETLKNSVKDYRSPDEILKEAKEITDKICVSEYNELSNYIKCSEEALKERLTKLEVSVKERESSYDEIKAILNRIDSDIKSKPNINDIIVEVDKKYKIPEDLMKILLGRIESAFGCLHDLTNEERKDIRNVLSTNPGGPIEHKK